MEIIVRKREHHYPSTYFVLKKGNNFYLLFWLEYDLDNSLYVWFDDDPDNSWEVIAKHRQDDLKGAQRVHFYHKQYEIFDPHLSWHQSGRTHVRGYNIQGKKREQVIEDRLTDNFDDLRSGVTTSFTQIIMPTTNAKKTLKHLKKGMGQFINPESFMMVIDKKGLKTINSGASAEAYIIIDENIIPKSFELGVDISIHHRDNAPNPNSTQGFIKSMLHPEQISLLKGMSEVAACIRIFGVENKGLNNGGILHTVATCFNKETIDIFQLKKL